MLHDEEIYNKLQDTFAQLPDGTYRIDLIEGDDDKILLLLSEFTHARWWQRFLCKHLHICLGGEWHETSLIRIDND